MEVYKNGVLFSDNFDLPSPPTSLVEESKSFDSITLSCIQKLSPKVTGVVVHYQNMHNPQDSGRLEAADCTKVVVTNLRPLSFYRMAIQQTTLAGNSGFSSPLTTNTLLSSSPTQLEASSSTTMGRRVSCRDGRILVVIVHHCYDPKCLGGRIAEYLTI